MKKLLKIFTFLSLIFTMACFFLPFLTFKNYRAISGINLITSLFKITELEKLSPSTQTCLFTSSSLTLLLSFAIYLLVTGIILYYIKKENSKALSFASFLSAVAVILYGIQLSNSQTSMADFFGTLLLVSKQANGKTIYKPADIFVKTGVGAQLLVILCFVSLILVIALKVLDRVEKNRGDAIQTPWTMAFKQLKRNKLAIIGIIILTILIIICFYGPVFSRYPLLKTDILSSKEKPSIHHLIGTDSSGRDILTRLMYGGRISMTVGFVAVLLEVLIGTLIGGVAGYYGGIIDNILMRVVDIFLSLPYLPVVIICGAIMSDLNIPPQARIYFVMLIIGILGWPIMARLVRGQILTLREQEFMIAADALGLKDRHKITRHLIPNVIPNIIVTSTLGIGDAILAESALSFLGLGVAMPFPSWGNIIQAVRDPNDFVLRTWLWFPAGICIFVTVLAINFMGDGLRDAFDPKMKK